MLAIYDLKCFLQHYQHSDNLDNSESFLSESSQSAIKELVMQIVKKFPEEILPKLMLADISPIKNHNVINIFSILKIV
jgi:hypothetical protein